MAGSVNTTPGFQLQPSADQVPLSTNYITNFNFLNQYLPDTYEKEFERYGNRTVASFLRMVGAELPSNSDLIKWAEQGRLHTKYVECGTTAIATANVATFQVNDVLNANGFVGGHTANNIAIRVGQTVMLDQNNGTGSNKAIVTDVDLTLNQFDVAFYDAGGYAGVAGALTDTNVTVFIYGSEFEKGTLGMDGSLEAEDEIFECSPIILKDKYAVNGSDMAQIGWIEVTTENGANGYLWYMKSEHETRLRFDDYLETSMLEAVPADVVTFGLAVCPPLWLTSMQSSLAWISRVPSRRTSSSLTVTSGLPSTICWLLRIATVLAELATACSTTTSRWLSTLASQASAVVTTSTSLTGST